MQRDRSVIAMTEPASSNGVPRPPRCRSWRPLRNAEGAHRRFRDANAQLGAGLAARLQRKPPPLPGTAIMDGLTSPWVGVSHLVGPFGEGVEVDQPGGEE